MVSHSTVLPYSACAHAVPAATLSGIAPCMQAVIARYGAWEVDDAQPVAVKIRELSGDNTISGSSSTDGQGGSTCNQIEIAVTDVGHGIPAGKAAHMYDYFWSASKPSNTL